MKFMYLKCRLKRSVTMVYSEGRGLSSHLGLNISLSLCGPIPMTWANAQINVIELYPLIDYSNNEGFPCRKSPFTTMNHIFFLSEPSKSPKFLEVRALNSTSILVRWSRVDEDSRNGIITRYTIHYEDMAKGSEGTVDILAPATKTIRTGLRQKAKYSFKILAATSKGDGPYSNTTEEETEGNTFQSNLATYSKMANHFS